MQIRRPFWEQLIEEAWQQKNVIWLMGVRRVGKTTLCRTLEDAEYFDCERPRVRELFVDPEGFLSAQQGKKIILDEIHRLDNPSEVLKLAADHYPTVKIIATGSSTLGASAKFKDTLTGRKKELWLTPLLFHESALFGNTDLVHRFLYGGCPSYFVKKELPEDDFKEWLDAYWAKDIQEMFRVGKRYSFQKCAELLLAQSGGQFEASKFAAPCGISRATVSNYLDVLEETFVVHVIRPYSTHKATEIVLAPKVYGFDTGFVCFAKGLRQLRKEDTGMLWEHCVLNEMHGYFQTRSIHYWRDKKGHEIDFVLINKFQNSLITVECKFTTVTMGAAMVAGIVKNIEAFRYHYPQGQNFVVASDVDTPFEKKQGDITLTFVNVTDFIKRVTALFKGG